jgi:two-component system nitrate/nitrite response regulator NarL
MTRVVVVAKPEDVRAALVAALRASPEFEVVDAGATVADVAADAELVVVARETRRGSRVGGVLDHDTASAPVLTHRERQILALLADGFGNKQIAARLGISTNTVKTHLELLFDKLDVSTRTEAVTAAARMGLLLL